MKMGLADFLSKRSELAALSCFMLFNLADVPNARSAIWGIVILTGLYMVLDGVKQWRGK